MKRTAARKPAPESTRPATKAAPKAPAAKKPAKKEAPKAKKPAAAETGRYAGRGVSASKKEVHAAVDRLDPGLFPGAFCKITRDFLTGDPRRCAVIHSDGAGTKSIVAYLEYRETGDASVFRGISQDSIVMNLDDLLCIGAVERILLSNTINRNARNVPGPALAELINGAESFIERLQSLGVDIHSGGGETADTGDLTGTVVVDSCAVAVLDRDAVITGDAITPGLAIVGMASAGRATYEDTENSGIGSNGLTSARHDLLSPYYRKYTEAYDPQTPTDLVYCGPYKLEDRLPESFLTVGEAILSPTRTYAPVVLTLLRDFPGMVRGLVHCSGGGQTKCIRFGRHVHFIKDNLFTPPPIFSAIQDASGTTPEEMHRVYNMGHRMEVYCLPSDAPTVIAVAKNYGIDARQIGRTEKSRERSGKNHITLTPANGGPTLTYAQK